MAVSSPPDKPNFPVLILVGRVAQAPVWENIEQGTARQRIQQLESDAQVAWFQAFDIRAYQLRSTKKTVTVIEEPDDAPVIKVEAKD